MPVLTNRSIPLAVGSLPEVDRQLTLRLRELTEKNPDYWTFASGSRSGDGGLFSVSSNDDPGNAAGADPYNNSACAGGKTSC